MYASHVLDFEAMTPGKAAAPSNYLCFAFAVGVASCGGGRGEPIDCSWFEGPNCWRDFRESVAACVPLITGVAQIADLSEDRQSCEYFDGTTVLFSEPLPASGDEEVLWDFEVQRDGETCLKHQDLRKQGKHGGFEATTEAGTFVMENTGSSLELTCPDGQEYSLAGSHIADCDHELLPTATISQSDGWYYYAYNGDPVTDGQVLNCVSDEYVW